MLTNKNTLDFQKNGAKSIKCPTSYTIGKLETQGTGATSGNPQAHANFCTDEDKRKAGPIEFKLQVVAA